MANWWGGRAEENQFRIDLKKIFEGILNKLELFSPGVLQKRKDEIPTKGQKEEKMALSLC